MLQVCFCTCYPKHAVMFRLRWPCIINVGEERTNRWHRYRCLFTIS